MHSIYMQYKIELDTLNNCRDVLLKYCETDDTVKDFIDKLYSDEDVEAKSRSEYLKEVVRREVGGTDLKHVLDYIQRSRYADEVLVEDIFGEMVPLSKFFDKVEPLREVLKKADEV